MSNDLTALRWQLIRTIEADQLLEQENIELRKKLQHAEEKLGTEVNLQRKSSSKIAMNMKLIVTGLREEMGEARSQYFAEMDLMKQGFKLVTGNLSQMSLKYTELKKKNASLQAVNELLKKDLEKVSSHSDKKTANMAGMCECSDVYMISYI
jgi:regulator of replication initiation timing